MDCKVVFRGQLLQRRKSGKAPRGMGTWKAPARSVTSSRRNHLNQSTTASRMFWGQWQQGHTGIMSDTGQPQIDFNRVVNKKVPGLLNHNRLRRTKCFEVWIFSNFGVSARRTQFNSCYIQSLKVML